jgi:hypothetical protein
MGHLPAPGSRPHMHDLFLLAVTAGNCHGDIRPYHLCLGHDRPLGNILQLSIVGVNREAQHPVGKPNSRISQGGTRTE